MTIESDNMEKYQKASTKWHSNCKRKMKRNTREGEKNRINKDERDFQSHSMSLQWTRRRWAYKSMNIYAYISYYDLYFRRCTHLLQTLNVHGCLINYWIIESIRCSIFFSGLSVIHITHRTWTEQSREWRDRWLDG